MGSSDKIIGWNILPEDSKSFRLQKLAELTKTFESLLNDILASEQERALVVKYKSVVIPRKSKQSSAESIAWEESLKSQKFEFVDWSADGPAKTSNDQKQDEKFFDWEAGMNKSPSSSDSEKPASAAATKQSSFQSRVSEHVQNPWVVDKPCDWGTDELEQSSIDQVEDEWERGWPKLLHPPQNTSDFEW